MAVDFAVVGGGVLGLTVATELRRREPGARVVVLEKEDAPGRHASGRNSGVLHAGFYYTPDSLKARFTRAGNVALTEYCEVRGLRIRKCGKLVVAKDASDWPRLDELKRRGERNGVPLVDLDESQARQVEPRARTFRRALFSPTTATVDPSEVMQSLARDAIRAGVEICTRAKYLGRRGNVLKTAVGDMVAGFVVNAAGLHADRVARDFGFSANHRILPFKGLYLHSSEPVDAFRTNVYPVPNLANPFLGVHVTVTVDGRAKLGPTAIPCLWREQYEGVGNFDASEAAEIVGLGLRLMVGAGFDFRRLAWEEVKMYARRHLVAQARGLAEGIREADFARWGRPGIRAQLVDRRTMSLEQDFVLEGDSGSLHVLNAVSPGWTCALPFARYVCDRIDEAMNGYAVNPPRSAALSTPS